MEHDQIVVPVNVVIPCFRCAHTVKCAIDSIVKQTHKPAGVILVDDASRDDTLGVLWELEKRYAGWIKVIALDENVGAGSARNAGWAIATQPYIAFLDADDSWHPEKLRIQYEYMRNKPDITLCGHQCVCLHNSDDPPVALENFPVTKISANSLLFKNAFSTPTVMLKRDIPFRFQEGKHFAEDFLLWQQIAFAGLQVVRLESPLAYVHKSLYGAGGLSAQLWKMEGGELSNFAFLYRAASINFPLYAISVFFSVVKFMKRVLVTRLRGLIKLLLRRGGGVA